MISNFFRSFLRSEITLVLVIFFVIASTFFRQYILWGKIPFPSNLLVTLYSPWRNVDIPGYPNGPANKPIGYDNIRQLYPYKLFTYQELKSGRLPLWNPYVFSGNVHLATYQAAVWYPLERLLTLIMPIIDAWSVQAFLTPILAGFGMYLFLRASYRSKLASLFGAMSFAFSGWMIVYWEETIVMAHSFLWLPYALYASELLWRGKRIVFGNTILILSLASSIFAGFLQMTLYVFIVIVTWNFYRYWQEPSKYRSIRTLIFLFVSIFLTLLITSVQWIPAIDAFSRSPRGVTDAKYLFSSFLVPLDHLITFIAPDFWGNPGAYNYFGTGFYFEKILYIGIVPLIASILGFFGTHRSLLFWKWAAIIALSLGFALPTSWIWYVLHIPVLSSALPTRTFAISAFALSVLASHGFDLFLSRNVRHHLIGILSFLAFVLAIIWGVIGMAWLLQYKYIEIFSFCGQTANKLVSVLCEPTRLLEFRKASLPYATISLRNLIIPSLFLLSSGCLFLINRKKRVVILLLLLNMLGSAYYFAGKYLYFSERQFVYPEVPVVERLRELAKYDRVWGYGNAFIEKNISSVLSLYSTDGYDAIFPMRYGRLLHSVRSNGDLQADIPRSDADLVEASEKEPLDANRVRLRLMRLLGVRYILESKRGDDKNHLSTDKRFNPKLFSIVWEDSIWRIWRFEQSLPRTIAVANSIVLHSENDQLETVLSESFDTEDAVIIENGLPRDTPSDFIGSSTILSYLPSQVILEANLSAPGYVVLSDTYDPNWKVFVDDREKKVLRANYAFRAVEVPLGLHKIRFSYEPIWITLGLYGTIVGIIATVFYLYIISKRLIPV